MIDFQDDEERRERDRFGTNPPPGPSPAPPDLAPAPSSGFDVGKAISDLNKKYGGQGVESEDAAKLQRLAQQGTQGNGESVESYLRELESKQQRRTAPTSDRRFDSQSSNYNQKTNQLSSQGQQALQGMQVPSPTLDPQFSDPITKFIEQFAQQRAKQLENPQAGSGQQLLEQALRDISSQFKQGGFTPGEQEVFQTQALDPLEQLRRARKQQVMHELSARGITPNSGVALQMLADVDRQFDGQRSVMQRNIAAQGAQETQQRMLQAVQLLSALAGGENSRLNEAFQYRTVPMNLADRAFSQASSLYNMSGNPLQMAGPLMQLSQMQQGRSDNWQETLGYLAAILSGR
jgi:hypothetical protein